MNKQEIISALYNITDLADNLVHDNGVGDKVRELISAIEAAKLPQAETGDVADTWHGTNPSGAL